MKANLKLFPEINPNPVLSVGIDGILLYSNQAGKPLLQEWDVKVGDRVPPNIVGIVQQVISRKIPEKIEVKAENRVYLLSLHPLQEE